MYLILVSERIAGEDANNSVLKVHCYFYGSTKFFQPGLLLKHVPMLIVSTLVSPVQC